MISFLGMTKPKQGMINPHPLSVGDGLPTLTMAGQNQKQIG